MSRTTIAFLGQCQTSGYAGVPPARTFPQVCRRAIEAGRPGTRLKVLLEPYYHPSELPGAVQKALLSGPRAIVIEVIGWLSISGLRAVDLSRLPSRVRTVYERVRYFRHVSQTIVAKIPHASGLVHHVHTTGTEIADGILRTLVPRYPRPTLAEYEAFLDQAIAKVGGTPGTYVVVQGPGAPNLELDACDLAPDALERYKGVETMARRVAAARKALYIDRWDTSSPGFFLPGSIRPHAQGHTVWGHLLAKELMVAGVV